MSGRSSYWWSAFNARPLGMPIPPNWFGLASFALLGAFVNPGFWVIGVGLELAYLTALAYNPRFRKLIDAGSERGDPVDQRYQAQLAQLERAQQVRQHQIEMRAREILASLRSSPIMAAHADSLEQLVWLHLRLLVARQAMARVLTTARQESKALSAQEQQIGERLAKPDIGEELRRSLQQQQAVIDQRQAAHADAERRLEHVESELQRIDQQIALIREQALLATDEQSLGDSLDALAASFNEANRWLGKQRDLLGVLDSQQDLRLPARVLRGDAASPVPEQGERS